MNHKKLNEKTEVLSQLITLTAELYNGVNESQKALLETLIGAGIWYLPSDRQILFNGKISRAALEQLKADPKHTKLVEEHGRMPRKVAGKTLYTDYLQEIDQSGNRLKDLYLTEMGKFNYVLKSENNRLARFQRAENFVDEETAYRLAGIEMLPISFEEIERLKRL